MLPRRLEPEVMDTEPDAHDYDAMDHSAVNRLFVDDLLTFATGWLDWASPILDVGTGPAHIPIELCRRVPQCRVVAVDLAQHMLTLAQRNLQAAGISQQVQLVRTNARALALADASFALVISNSIIHHIPQPRDCIAELVRVTRPGGGLFVRDLLRPTSYAELDRLVDLHAAGANAHQRQLFADSLHAALTVDEMRQLVAEFGFDPGSVAVTSDRHWTWAARKPGVSA